MPDSRVSYSPVLQSVFASDGKPFNILGLARATGLETKRAYTALTYLLDVGLVRVIGERHVPGRRGRGERLYALVKDLHEKPDGILAHVHLVTDSFSRFAQFTAVEVIEKLGNRASGWPLYHTTTVRLALEILESRGVIVRVLDVTLGKVGRKAYRWTSNPENMAAQRKIAELISAEDKNRKSAPPI